MAEEKKAPVGTQRYWESTGQTWIKTHDNTLFDNYQPAWMPIPSIPRIFTDKFKELDELGRRILKFKEPVDGDLWLEKEFSNFQTQSGKKFTAAEFKQYYKFQPNTAVYSFNNELTKRYIQDKIDVNAKIAETLVELNDAKKTRMLREGKSITEKPIVLTEDEIKEVREQVRRDYKEDTDKKLTIEDCDNIQSILNRVVNYLDQGENFEGEQKEIYEQCKITLDKIKSGPYININIIREEMKEALSLMGKHFSDNWGIRESFRKKIEYAFGNYVSKYRREIEKDELESFQSKLGCSLYAPTEEFYSHLESSTFFTPLNISEYIGKYISDPRDKYRDVILTNATIDSDNDYKVIYTNSAGRENETFLTRQERTTLIRQRQTNSPDLDVPLKLRFSKLYNKELGGSFGEENIPLLHTFEKVANYLPKGHVLSNMDLTKIRKETIYGQDNSYAHYNSNRREIFLSDKALKESELGVTNINDGNQIASVLIHEIGHSVSQKLGRRGSKEYRKFVVECGWSWEQFKPGSNYMATDTDKDISRFGSKADIPLITTYAHKSPEEAFAEYYSFYSQHKSIIDEYLQTRKQRILDKSSEIELNLGTLTFGEHLSLGDEKRHKREAMHALMIDNNRDIEDHIRTGVIDPYYDNLESISQKDIASPLIAYQKRDSSKNRNIPVPVFTVFDHFTGKHDLIIDEGSEDAAIHYSNKYLRRVSPTFCISKECYKLLKNAGYNYNDIRDYALSSVASKQMPKVTTEGEAIVHRARGLRYAGNLVESSIIAKGESIFKQMKQIWESEELRKALEQLGFSYVKENSMKNKLEKSIIDTLSSVYKPFADKIKEIIQKAMPTKTSIKLYADSIIRNSQGDILLLQRSHEDTFQPSKWCLPGGKIEEGEDPIIAAERELSEETGFDFSGQLQYVNKIERKESITYYFEATISNQNFTILNNQNDEHIQIKFVPWKDVLDYNLILDLKDILISKLALELESLQTPDIRAFDYTDLIKDLELKFNKGQIDEEQYFNQRNNLLRKVEESIEHKYGCVMVNFEFPELKDIQAIIDENDLVMTDIDGRELGLELDPHVTLLYGLHSNEIKQDNTIIAIASEEEIGDILLTEISLFSNPKYDVLKFIAVNPDLFKINEALRSNFPYTCNFDYNPHSTIAYLKPGMGQKYVDLFRGLEFIVTPQQIVYSKPDGSKISSVESIPNPFNELSIIKSYSDIYDREDIPNSDKLLLAKQRAFEIIKAGFDQGFVVEEQYFSAIDNLYRNT